MSKSCKSDFFIFVMVGGYAVIQHVLGWPLLHKALFDFLALSLALSLSRALPNLSPVSHSHVSLFLSGGDTGDCTNEEHGALLKVFF